ncbi:hypothetical protein [Microbacterium gorillae]|uniref:hypothetical protein n=1 Tax=Microbacterium gorillae TaxID=1231063 RepID=UPI0006946DE9|nr:hypothetical protein [Microbacterium gorillae]
MTFTVIHLVSSGGQQNALERVIYLCLPFGFSLLAIGAMLLTGSLWAAIGVHSGIHLGTAAAMAWLPAVSGPAWWALAGGVQAALGLTLIVTARRRDPAVQRRARASRSTKTPIRR